MNLIKKLLLLITIAFAISCNQKDTNKSNGSNVPARQGTTGESEEKETEVATNDDIGSSEVFQKLQGTWINRTDALSTLTFQGSSVINAYQDTLSRRTVEFVLGNSCLNSPAVAEDDKKDLFITTTGQTSECYFIKELNDSILTMEFLSGKIDLTFTRQK